MRLFGWSVVVRHLATAAVQVEKHRGRLVGRVGSRNSPTNTFHSSRLSACEPPSFEGDQTLLPGLIDAHTHLLFQGDPLAAIIELERVSFVMKNGVGSAKNRDSGWFRACANPAAEPNARGTRTLER